ncbi:hypothetical protein EHLJMEHL_02226 [Vreelandella titanicae]
MSYETWRATYQDSEQAAKAAYADAKRWERLFAMAIGSLVEVAEAAGIRKEDQLTGGTFQTLAAIKKLKERRDKWKDRALKAEKVNRDLFRFGINPVRMPSQPAALNGKLSGGDHAAR